MNNDWLLFAYIIISIFTALSISELLRKYFDKPPEFTRPVIHVFIGLIVSICPFIFKSNNQIVTLSIAFIIINAILSMSNKIASINVISRISYGTIYFPISALVLGTFFWEKPISFTIAMLVLTIADPIAAKIGSTSKSFFMPWIDKKSYNGAIGMFCASFVIVLIGTDIMSKVYAAKYFIPLHILIGLSIFTALCATLSELISYRGSDNLSIPLVSFISYEIFLVNYTHGNLPELICWVIISMIIFLTAYKKQSLSLSGAIGGFIVGVIIIGSGGWKWIVPLALFFLSSSFLSHLKNKPPSMRNLIQILSNGGLACLVAIANFFFPLPFLPLIFIGSLAAATSDTWATEIGYYSKVSPRLIFSQTNIDRGFSGGFTWLGFIGSIAGAALIATTGAIIFDMPNMIIPLIICGIFGSLFDSILGRFFQGQFKCEKCSELNEKKIHCGQPGLLINGYKWLDNNLVNFANTLMGSIVILGFYFYG